MTTSIANFFEDATKGGGGGLPGAATFDFQGQSAAGIGLSVAGEIVDVYESQMTEQDPPHAKRFDKNGKAMMQLAVTLQTDLRNWAGAKKPYVDKETNQPVEDTGLRKVYLRFQGARATAQAVQEAGATFDDFVAGTGAKLYVRRIENDGQMNQFEAKFQKGTKTPPAATGFLDNASAGAPSSLPPAGDPFGASAPAPSAPPATDPWASSPASSDEPPF